MSIFQEMINALNEQFAPLNEKLENDTYQWVVGHLNEYRSTVKKLTATQHDERSRLTRKYQDIMGKGWFKVATTGNSESILEAVRKNCYTTSVKRINTITNKLIKAGVTSVISTKVVGNCDGFNGTFLVNTEKGFKTVTIETIYAGGYNIQCFHLRVLTKIK